MNGLIGKKLGMSQIFAADGTLIPVTVIQAGPCTIVQKKPTNAMDILPSSWDLVHGSFSVLLSRLLDTARRPMLPRLPCYESSILTTLISMKLVVRSMLPMSFPPEKLLMSSGRPKGGALLVSLNDMGCQVFPDRAGHTSIFGMVGQLVTALFPVVSSKENEWQGSMATLE